MRVILLLLFAFNLYSCQAQNKEVNRIDVKLDMTELQRKGAHFEKARVLAVDDDFAIGQIGLVDIFLIDLKSGNAIKSIDTDLILKSLEEHISGLLGGEYYVPDNQENLRSKYVGVVPYEFRGLFYLREKRKFVINMVTVLFNRKDDLDQQLFLSLVLFDKNLEHVEIIPFDPLNRSTNSGWIHGGFFLGQDRMFTKVLAWKHDYDFDFVEYRLTDDHIYTISDTLFGVKADTLGYVGRFHGCFTFNDRNYLNLGSTLYTFEGGNIKEGHIQPFPHNLERNFLYIEPIDENHLVAYAINNYRKDPEPFGWLLILDKDFAIKKVIITFDLREIVFCSLFTYGESVYVVNYDEKNERYFLLRYEDL